MSMKATILALFGLGALISALMLLPSAPRTALAPKPDAGKTQDAALSRSAQPGDSVVLAGESATKQGPLPRSATNEPSPQSSKPPANARDRERNMTELAMRLATLPPEQALARTSELPDQESRDMAMLALLGEWSGQSSLELIRRGDVWRFGVGGALAVHLLESGRITPAKAVAIVEQNTDGNRRGELFVQVGSKLASEDPGAAVALGNELEGWERQRFLEGLADQWAQSSPEEARRWITTVGDARTRDSLLAGLLQAETRKNPASAAANFPSLAPADDSARAQAAMRIASDWATKDTLAAMQWAESLPGEAERNAAQQGVHSAAPVGIGAMLTRGNDGRPVIGNLVPGGPASASGVVQAGDTLLAVSDGNGAWIDTRNLRTREVLSLVRGEPNTQVSLQVLSPGSSAPRTVTLGRQQIIFRPSQ